MNYALGMYIGFVALFGMYFREHAVRVAMLHHRRTEYFWWTLIKAWAWPLTLLIWGFFNLNIDDQYKK